MAPENHLAPENTSTVLKCFGTIRPAKGPTLTVQLEQLDSGRRTLALRLSTGPAFYVALWNVAPLAELLCDAADGLDDERATGR